MEAFLKQLAEGGPYALGLALLALAVWKGGRVFWPWFIKQEEERREETRITFERLASAHEHVSERLATTHKDDTTRITAHLGKIHDRQAEQGETLAEIKAAVARKATRRETTPGENRAGQG